MSIVKTWQRSAEPCHVDCFNQKPVVVIETVVVGSIVPPLFGVNCTVFLKLKIILDLITLLVFVFFFIVLFFNYQKLERDGLN